MQNITHTEDNLAWLTDEKMEEKKIIICHAT